MAMKQIVSSGQDYPRGSDAWMSDFIGIIVAVLIPNVFMAMVYGASKPLAYYAIFSGVVVLGIFAFLCVEALKYERKSSSS